MSIPFSGLDDRRVGVLATWERARGAALPERPALFKSGMGYPDWTACGPRSGQIHGLFSDPLALSVFIGTIACSCIWTRLQGHKLLKPRVLLLVGLLVMLLTTSTTGFWALVIIGCDIPLYALSRGDTRLMFAA